MSTTYCFLSGLLHETPPSSDRNFEMKDMGESHMSLALR